MMCYRFYIVKSLGYPSKTPHSVIEFPTLTVNTKRYVASNVMELTSDNNKHGWSCDVVSPSNATRLSAEKHATVSITRAL